MLPDIHLNYQGLCSLATEICCHSTKINVTDPSTYCPVGCLLWVFWRKSTLLYVMHHKVFISGQAGIILCMRSANGRGRYIVTSSLIGRAHIQNVLEVQGGCGHAAANCGHRAKSMWSNYRPRWLLNVSPVGSNNSYEKGLSVYTIHA